MSEERVKELEKFAVSNLFSAMITFSFFYLILLPEGRELIEHFTSSVNIAIYILGVVLFLATDALLLRSNRFYTLISKHITLILVIFLQCCFFNRMFEVQRTAESTDASRPIYTMNKFLLCFLIILVTVLILAALKLKSSRVLKVIEIASIVYSMFCVYRGLAHGKMFYGGVVNSEATLSGIYNAYYGGPISDVSYCIYGHYGLFYIPILKLFGFSHNRIVFLQLLLAISIMMVFIYAIHKMVDNTVLRIPSVIALGMLWGQFIPADWNDNAIIRMVPGAAIIWFIVFVHDRIHDDKYIRCVYVAGYAIGTFGIIWNLEFGLVATATWAVFVIYHSVCVRGRRFVLVFLSSLTMIIISFILSWVFTGMTNVIMGGEFLSIRTYCIPHFNRTYMVDGLQIPIVRSELVWQFVLFIGLIGVSVGFKDLFFQKIRPVEKNRNAVIACVSINMMGGPPTISIDFGAEICLLFGCR